MKRVVNANARVYSWPSQPANMLDVLQTLRFISASLYYVVRVKPLNELPSCQDAV